MIPITEYSGREIAVFGLARTGLAAARALTAGGARVHAWDDDERVRAAAEEAGVPTSDINARGWGAFAALVLSPGVPLHFPQPHRIVDLANATGVPIVGDIELFARAVAALPAHARPRIVGVTGTNGKSTTTALIGHILMEAGKDARVGGNIGNAVLELPDLHAGAIYVLELSSFQLDLVNSLRCDVAVFLNATPDHLNRHGSMAGYVAAKKRIFANQGAGDCAVIGADDDVCVRICTELIAQGARSVIPISAGQALTGGSFAIGGKLFAAATLEFQGAHKGRPYNATGARADLVLDLAEAAALKGRHNAQNAAAAYAATRALGLDRREIANAIRTFPGLPHRLEQAGVVSGVRFVNDSKATNADAAAQALSVYPRAYWIAGGVAKEGGIAELARFFPRLSGAYLIGAAAGEFAKTIGKRAPVKMAGDLETAVAQAFVDARDAGEGAPVVLLSPACASYDQFRDFEERGEAFKRIVQGIARAAAEHRSQVRA